MAHPVRGRLCLRLPVQQGRHAVLQRHAPKTEGIRSRSGTGKDPHPTLQPLSPRPAPSFRLSWIRTILEPRSAWRPQGDEKDGTQETARSQKTNERVDQSQAPSTGAHVHPGFEPKVGRALQLLRSAQQRKVPGQLLRLRDQKRLQVAQSQRREEEQFQLGTIQRSAEEVERRLARSG